MISYTVRCTGVGARFLAMQSSTLGRRKELRLFSGDGAERGVAGEKCKFG